MVATNLCQLRRFAMNKLLKLADVEKTIGFKKSAIYRLVSDGLFPPPVKFGFSSFWPDYEVERMVSAIIANISEDQVKKLVIEITKERKIAAIN